ncbi:hypothetical protein D3C78_1924760 [compost metagenome]
MEVLVGSYPRQGFVFIPFHEPGEVDDFLIDFISGHAKLDQAIGNDCDPFVYCMDTPGAIGGLKQQVKAPWT